jgi:hypothetical protein
MKVLTLLQKMAHLVGLQSSFQSIEQDNSHSDTLLAFAVTANTELFSRVPRDSLLYTKEVSLTLQEGRNSVALPPPYTASDVGETIIVQPLEFVGTSEGKRVCARVGSEGLLVTPTEGEPSAFGTLHNNAVLFDKVATRPYRATVLVTSLLKPFATEMEELDYPQQFLDFITYKGASLYTGSRGFGDNEIRFLRQAELAFAGIMATEQRANPYVYTKTQGRQSTMGGIHGYY